MVLPASSYVNRIATAVPENDINSLFLGFARSRLAEQPRQRHAFDRMMEKAGIDHRYSCFSPYELGGELRVDLEGASTRASCISTAARMDMYARTAPELAQRALDRLELGSDADRLTHLIVTSCTGFSAPGIDLEIMARCRLPRSMERTIIGFMGCYAAINALKQARHIVRSEPQARVLVLNVELCTLHMNEATDLGKLLSLCLWGDGCAASLVTADPVGLAIDSFHAIVDQSHRELMTWTIGENGFDMVLSGQVPLAIQEILGGAITEILGNERAEHVELWAIHPGGRSVLDAVERTLHLGPGALEASRDILRRYGNMSSATIMFVLERMLNARRPGQAGCAMAFGPGLTTETMRFHTAGTA
jgi:predicted naringenin-chalcone synthase